MKHGLSIDVEDYYQIIYQDYFRKKEPPSFEVEYNTNKLLDTMGASRSKATFFILGNVVHQFPKLAKRIVNEGHEIGIHGYDHKYISKIKPEEFRDEIKRAKNEVEQLSGGRVFGHRAPAFSITEESFWAIDILLEEGFIYDSSIYPIKGKRYGIKGTRKTIYSWPNGLYEIPLSCLDIIGKTVPAAGGGYIRHFPYWWTKFSIRRLQELQRPAVVYLHPYEFEESYPAIPSQYKPIPLKLKVHTIMQAHNRGGKQKKKLDLLLHDFTFVPLKDLLVCKSSLSCSR